MTEYDEDSIPSHALKSNGREWTYEKLDPRTHQWTRPLDQEEFDWDVSNVDLVGTDVPVRVVSLELHDGWTVQGLETAGPDYHRPGFTETISSDYVSSTADLEEAIEMVEDFVARLS
ncbi:hypothetical protein C5B90_14105 [Haloferax sp. Atlit-12N]|uniref:hypothetical protein n=1 Tax=Haloferax sp. Atlit-12N TaxID=2077203 RepID=UPI000E247102|nr:hypothetical protein [Haloferax sp. Atlit-12N]RDZ64219.1 hypothetical protein C5B90_14105 [Haloferax sp. Atlit-12N]